MSKIGSYVIDLIEQGKYPELPTRPDKDNSYCEDGKRWTDKRRQEANEAQDRVQPVSDGTE